MVRDFWEFTNKETKARVIFGAVIAVVVLVIAIPYFVSVLGSHPKSDMATVVEAEEPEKSEETEKVEEAKETKVASEPAPVESEEVESAEAYPDTSTGITNVATTRGASQTTAPATSQPASNPAPVETPKATRVDDRMSGSEDDGYTASGVDEPGATEPEQTDGGEN